MRISIKYKLFFTLFLTTSIVVVSMYFFMQWSFHRGFLNYANSQDLKNMDSLADNLLEVYRTTGSWRSLRGNNALWRRILNGSNQVPDNPEVEMPPGPPGPINAGLPVNRLDPMRVGPRTMLLDADKNRIIGGDIRRGIDIRKMGVKPLEMDGETVGYLAIIPMVKLSETGDRLYVERQTRIFGMIALAMILVSVLLAIPLVYQLLVPVKAMIKGAEKLTNGDYSVRIPITTGDELANLSAHFNLLAATLERNEKSRRRYMADVSHELRTPLSVLLGEIEAVQDGVRDVDSTLPVLHGEVTHLNRLVDDLHELSLSDIGALSYRKQRIDPVIALEQAVERYAPRMADSNIALTVNLPEEGTLAINADPNRLQQLFTNLLENSLRYTDRGGQVEVEMHQTVKQLKVEFRDSSPGVSEEQRAQLFTRFYRVEASRSRTGGGSGLGLAICWNIVDAHQGKIEAYPSSLGGLRMVITLPLL